MSYKDERNRRPEQKCVHPDCNTMVRAGARMIVCAEHKHNPEYCNCLSCAQNRHKRRSGPKQYKVPGMSVPPWEKTQ